MSTTLNIKRTTLLVIIQPQKHTNLLCWMEIKHRFASVPPLTFSSCQLPRFQKNELVVSKEYEETRGLMLCQRSHAHAERRPEICIRMCIWHRVYVTLKKNFTLLIHRKTHCIWRTTTTTKKRHKTPQNSLGSKMWNILASHAVFTQRTAAKDSYSTINNTILNF